MSGTATNGRESILSDATPEKAIVKLAVPATLALLAKAVYNIVDTAYIGMLDSDIALAAVGVTLPLLLIMVSVENIFAAGAAVLAGRQLGANDRESANRTVTTIVGLSMLIGVGLCILGLLFMEPLLRAFGASDAVLPQAKDYAFWMFIAVQPPRPKPQLRGQSGILGKNFFRRRDRRRASECAAGPGVHVLLGI